ncbi:MAG TPA: aminotransferase class III-fold pyridoxal phosphate-dependent enzyme [Pseudonocardiaceae bacterium]
MRFGFLAHPTNEGQRNQVRASTLVGDWLYRRTGRTPTVGHVRMPMFGTVTSATGASCEGEVRYLPHTAPDLLADHAAAARYVAGQAEGLIANGAELIGLGGATSIVGGRGVATQRAVGVPVTSGNSLTTFAAHALVGTVLEQVGHEPGAIEVGVIGFPGSIGLAMARLLLDDGHRVLLVCRKGRVDPAALLAALPEHARDRAEVTDDVAACLRRTRMVVAASSAGGVVDPAALLPGSVVVDVALPRDVPETDHGRRDVLILDGGLVSASAAVAMDNLTFGFTEQLNGCLAETIVLALEGRAESFSLGGELDPDRIREIGAIAARHGFTTAPPASYGRPVPLERIAELRRHHCRAGTPGPRRDDEALARDRFRTHLNPPLGTLYATHDLDRVFTGGRGCVLSTEDGTEYLDFVAGYGCLNVGHNHPAVTAALRRFLDRGEPTFVQYTSVPVRTAELAERLAAIAPGRMERVFFSNSGTEAVEAALKLARAATGRTRLVYTDNSYHGKTLGALSVTGRVKHREPFGPLLPDCVPVPYGDLDALREAVRGAAAFIVEPVQGEGGVVLPPPGYLAAARRLCREAGAVFVVDEIQTGLGRTGALFACEHEGVEPDVLCLAKSLSGGLVPIGATLATAEVWDAGYGTTTRSVLHTSTFGGGNLASAVALATLDVLRDEELPARAAAVGGRLRAALTEALAPFPIVGEVRGVGLMNAIAFEGGYDGAVRAVADDLLTRLPGNLYQLADTLPDDVRGALRGAADAVEGALRDLLCMRFVGAMGRDHRMLAFVTANSNRVVRIQPPLVLDDDQADRFVTAAAAVCDSLTDRL